MTFRHKTIQLAKRLGVELEYGGVGGEFEVTADAPDGYTFSWEPGLHGLVSSTWDDETPEQVWQDMWERLSFGIEKES